MIVVVVGLLILAGLSTLVIGSSKVSRRVRKLSRFAHERHPELFREPVGRFEAVSVIQEAHEMPMHFDLACFLVLMTRGLATAEGHALAVDVLRQWDEAYREGMRQW